MRVGLISDIHGNSVALDAVLDELRAVDEILCLGDIAANGPDPSGVVAMLEEAEVASVMGNTDAGLIDMPSWWLDPSSAGIPEDAHPGIEIGVWCADQLTQDERAFIEGLPMRYEMDLGSAGRLLGFHGSPRSYDDIIQAASREDEVRAMLGGVMHEILAGGHTHVPMIRRLGHQTLINPGSVGLPFAGYGYAGSVPVLPLASFGILEIEGQAVSMSLRQVAIDMSRLGDLVRSSGMPHADWWLSRWTPF